MRPGLDIGGGRWWIFSWLQIWPDGDSFVWASKKGGGSKYTLKCWLWEFLKVAAVNTLSTPRDETKRNVSHSFLSMMNVTGQWPSSWLFIWSRAEMMERRGWLSWWCPHQGWSIFPNIIIIIIICPKTKGRDMTLLTLFSSANDSAHTCVTLTTLLMSQSVSWPESEVLFCLIAS